jgi:hypothetical protein
MTNEEADEMIQALESLTDVEFLDGQVESIKEQQGELPYNDARLLEAMIRRIIKIRDYLKEVENAGTD